MTERSGEKFNRTQKGEIESMILQGINDFNEKNYKEFALLKSLLVLPKMQERINEVKKQIYKTITKEKLKSTQVLTSSETPEYKLAKTFASSDKITLDKKKFSDTLPGISKGKLPIKNYNRSRAGKLNQYETAQNLKSNTGIDIQIKSKSSIKDTSADDLLLHSFHEPIRKLKTSNLHDKQLIRTSKDKIAKEIAKKAKISSLHKSIKNDI